MMKIAYLSGDLTILNLNNVVKEYWNYFQPITMQETKSVFCVFWHKYCAYFGIGISTVKPVT